MQGRGTNLLLPGLQLLNQEVVALGDLAELGVHATLEVDEILPSFHRIARVLVPLTDNFIQMAHGNLGHERLLNRATKDGLHASVASLVHRLLVKNNSHMICAQGLLTNFSHT